MPLESHPSHLLALNVETIFSHHSCCLLMTAVESWLRYNIFLELVLTYYLLEKITWEAVVCVFIPIFNLLGDVYMKVCCISIPNSSFVSTISMTSSWVINWNKHLKLGFTPWKKVTGPLYSIGFYPVLSPKLERDFGYHLGQSPHFIEE